MIESVTKKSINLGVESKPRYSEFPFFTSFVLLQ